MRIRWLLVRSDEINKKKCRPLKVYRFDVVWLNDVASLNTSFIWWIFKQISEIFCAGCVCKILFLPLFRLDLRQWVSNDKCSIDGQTSQRGKCDKKISWEFSPNGPWNMCQKWNIETKNRLNDPNRFDSSASHLHFCEKVNVLIIRAANHWFIFIVVTFKIKNSLWIKEWHCERNVVPWNQRKTNQFRSKRITSQMH